MRLAEPRDAALLSMSDEDLAVVYCDATGIDLELLEHDGRRWNKFQNWKHWVGFFRRTAFATGESEGFTHRINVAAACWEGIDSKERMKCTTTQQREWQHIAERGGLLEIRPDLSARGLRWRLLDGQPRYDCEIRGYSSDGEVKAPTGRRGRCELHRRRETRAEIRDRRVRPWCRRVGNNSTRNRRAVRRFDLVASSLFAEKPPPSGLAPLKGGPNQQGPEVGSGAGVDTTGPKKLESRRAALKRERRLSFEGGLPEIEAQLAAQSFGVVALVDRGPLLEALEWLQRTLENRGRSLDRPVSATAALDVLAAKLSSEVTGRRERGLRPVRSLNWFVPAIRAEARRTEGLNRRRALAPYVRLLRRLMEIDRRRCPDAPHRGPSERQLYLAVVRRNLWFMADQELATLARELLPPPRRGSGDRHIAP